VHLSGRHRQVYDTFLDMAARIPLNVTLYMNIYPLGIGPILNTPLRATDLHLASGPANPSIDCYQPMLCASVATPERLPKYR